MAYLILFLAGILAEKYVFPSLDILLGVISNKFAVSSGLTQKILEDMGLDDAVSETNAIGFVCEEDYYIDEE